MEHNSEGERGEVEANQGEGLACAGFDRVTVRASDKIPPPHSIASPWVRRSALGHDVALGSLTSVWRLRRTLPVYPKLRTPGCSARSDEKGQERKSLARPDRLVRPAITSRGYGVMPA